MTALVTPFKKGRVDTEGLKKNVQFQVEGGVNSLLILGTTGEGATLSCEERAQVIRIVSKDKKIPIVVNVGEVSTEQTIARAKQGETLGADALLVIAPYYLLPSQEGLALHFEKVAQATSLPLFLYHHPKRTGVAFSMQLLDRLASQKNIVGIKEASGSIAFAATISHHFPHFLLFAGDDCASLPLLSIGAVGVVSVLSNLIPETIVHMVHNRDLALYRKLVPLMQGTSIETNPVPIKAMMDQMGLPAGTVRLPLTPLSSDNQQIVETLLSTFSCARSGG